MQRTEKPESNRAAEIEATIRHNAAWRVVSVAPLPNFHLRIVFVDGTAGEIDMRAFLAEPNIEGTVFEPLRDPATFARAQVVLGAVQWPSGADLAPDAMYDAIRQRGVWIVD